APSSAHAYVVNELDSTVTSYHFNAEDGDMKPFQIESTLPDDFTGDSRAAALVIAPSGKLLFASNRGHDSVTVFKVDPPTGKIHALGNFSTKGKKPRFMTVSPDGRFLFAANEESDTIKAFSIKQTGELQLVEPQVQAGSPVCMIFRTA
ncbi:lactonase family protein, partial [Pseudomonas sp.]|uniref:lactonase family protein n=1 Tax=Pseudomonas sp. TaxID=306 RepID=UPI003CC51BE3